MFEETTMLDYDYVCLSTVLNMKPLQPLIGQHIFKNIMSIEA